MLFIMMIVPTVDGTKEFGGSHRINAWSLMNSGFINTIICAIVVINMFSLKKATGILITIDLFQRKQMPSAQWKE